MSKKTDIEELYKKVLKIYLDKKQGKRSAVDGCENEGISRSTYYRLKKKYNQNDGINLENKSKKPKNSPNKTSKQTKSLIHKLATSGIFKNASEIQKELLEKNSIPLSVNTVIKILGELNCFDPKPDKKLKNTPYSRINC